MLYLTGAKNPWVSDDLRDGRMGLLLTPSTGYLLDGVAVWAMDNGAFTGRYPGDDAYLRLLASLDAHRERCLFVAVQDVVGDAGATLDLFPRTAGRLRDRGWPVALVGQDGMDPARVPWDDLDWLFVGGSDRFKLGPGAMRLIVAAHRHRKRVHVGRVNSERRYRRFALLGCDSADGTHAAYHPLRAQEVRRWSALYGQRKKAWLDGLRRVEEER